MDRHYGHFVIALPKKTSVCGYDGSCPNVEPGAAELIKYEVRRALDLLEWAEPLPRMRKLATPILDFHDEHSGRCDDQRVNLGAHERLPLKVDVAVSLKPHIVENRTPKGKRPQFIYDSGLSRDTGKFLGSDNPLHALKPRAVRHWTLMTLREKLIKIGAKVARHSGKIVFQMAEVAVPRELFRAILERIGRLRLATAMSG